MGENIIDSIYKENLELLKYLQEQKEISFASQFDRTFKKSLLLSSASFFEEEICRIVQAFVERKTSNDKCITSLVKSKVIERQYHTYFDWKGNNANSFFKLFGDDFKKQLSEKVKNDPTLDSSIKAFLELGNMRNCLVHQNFANYIIDKTAEEVYQLYQKAMVFVQYLSDHLDNS
ncbi:MAG: HEPN domain-containing protein [Hassallia sp.]